MNYRPDSLSDSAVPGLGIALQADALLEMLAARLPEARAGLRFLEGRAVDVQYTPGVGAQVLWKIKVDDPETGRTGRQLIFVRALRSDEPIPEEPVELLRRYQELRESKGMERTMPIRTPWLAADDARVIVHAYPLDPTLPSLLTAADPNAMKIALQRVWHTRGARVRRVHVDVLSYTPGARAALQYEILAEDKKSQLPELRRLVGKIDVRRSPARLFAGHWAVWRKTFGKVSIAPPVGYVATARLSLQEFLTGTRLSDVERKGQLIGQLRKSARAIANVHALTLPVLKHRSVDKEMTGVDRWTRVLSQIRPEQANRLERLGTKLRSELAARMRVTGTVHADFHLANILAEKRGVTLIDWDQAAHGDPMLDVGRLLASLRVSALRMEKKLDGLSEVEDAFLEAYLEHSGEDEQRARLLEAASLITAAATPFRLQREGWQEYADQMIDEVERMLELSLRGPRVAGTSSEYRREVPFDERAPWAIDPVYSQALLVPIVHAAYGEDIEITECTPTLMASSAARIQPRWSLKGYQGDQKWKRVVDGIGFPEVSGRNILHRLETAHSVSSQLPSSLQLPRPLGRMGPLSIVVFEHAVAKRLDRSIDSDGDLLIRAARALSEFQSLSMDLGKERETRRFIRSVSRRVRSMERARHPFADAARDVMSSLDEIGNTLSDRRVPTLLPLTSRWLLVTDSSIGVSMFHDIVLSDPLLNAAGFLAELCMDSLEVGRDQACVDTFRDAYLNASGESPADLAAWEQLSLLRLACFRASRQPDSRIPYAMLSIAREGFDAHAMRPQAVAGSPSGRHGLIQDDQL